MGSLTRRMRKHAAIPERLAPVRGQPDAKPAISISRALQVEPPLRIESADHDRSRAFLETAQQPKVFTVADEAGHPVPAPRLPEPPPTLIVETPRRRANPMQLIALMGMLGAGLPSRGER